MIYNKINLMEILKFIWFLVWMFPQNLAGFFTALFTGFRYKGCMNGSLYFTKNGSGSVSLGVFIFVTEYSFKKNNNIPKHEYGHFVQSQYLGFLYLIVIGIPGGVACLFISDYDDYMSFYTERWANKLADKYFDDEKFNSTCRNLK